MITKIIDEIIRSDVITIFRHERADGDAFGSQCALAIWLRKYYPNKEVYCLGLNGKDNREQFCLMDTVEDNVIQESLAIILDTANTSRIDDQRYKIAKKIIKIDHHVLVEHYGDIEFVDPKRSSTCELVLTLINQAKPLSKNDQDIASLLYKGLLTDTLRFSTSNTTSSTLMSASYLADCNINVADISHDVFKRSMAYFKLATKLRSETIFTNNNRLAYVYLQQETIEAYGVKQEEAKDLVTEYNNLNELVAWVLFTEDEDIADIYNASLRSRGIRVDDIANKFNGGGHHQAAGVKGLTLKQTQEMIIMIKKRIIQTK